MAVPGFHEADMGVDKAAPVESLNYVRIFIALAAKHGHMRTAFLQARIGLHTRNPGMYGMRLC